MRLIKLLPAAFILILFTACPHENPYLFDGYGVYGEFAFNSASDNGITIHVIDQPTSLDEENLSGNFVQADSVTVNGEELAFDSSGNCYTDEGLNFSYTAGTEYAVHVQIGDILINETIVMPPAVTIISHSDGAELIASADNTIAYSLNPDTSDHFANEVFIYFISTENVAHRITFSHWPHLRSSTIYAEMELLSESIEGRLTVISKDRVDIFHEDLDPRSYFVAKNCETISINIVN